MNLIKKIARKIGFTETESKIILFLLTALIVGIIINIVKDSSGNSKLLEFDYTKEDSSFYSSDFYPDNKDSIEKNTQKKVESKPELSDFRTAEKEGKKLSGLFTESNKLDINKAGLNEFGLLPGIGLKTAQNIIDYREKIGRFNNIEELLKVKGIGKAKLDKIKSIITVK